MNETLVILSIAAGWMIFILVSYLQERSSKK